MFLSCVAISSNAKPLLVLKDVFMGVVTPRFVTDFYILWFLFVATTLIIIHEFDYLSMYFISTSVFVRSSYPTLPCYSKSSRV